MVSRVLPQYRHWGRSFKSVVKPHSIIERIMPNWLRILLAIAAGFVVWFAVATLGNIVIR